jgi:hypothetical protein
MRRAGKRWVFAAATVAAFAAMTPASAQELSEKAARAFMEYAWSLTPEAFTKPNGETIQIDKTKRDQVMVPVEVAREVIYAGRLSAHAQVCELSKEQADNHNSLMRREIESKKWSPQQIVYINQLHLTVVMLLTGRIKLVEKDGDKQVVIEDTQKQPTQSCSAEQKQKVKDMITAYVKTGPALAAAPAGAPATAAAPAPPKPATETAAGGQTAVPK